MFREFLCTGNCCSPELLEKEHLGGHRHVSGGGDGRWNPGHSIHLFVLKRKQTNVSSTRDIRNSNTSPKCIHPKEWSFLVKTNCHSAYSICHGGLAQSTDYSTVFGKDPGNLQFVIQVVKGKLVASVTVHWLHSRAFNKYVD